MRGLKRAKQIIKDSKTILIACHVNPDGDCIGSLLSLGLALKKIGKRVYLVSPGGVPRDYRALPGAGLIRRTVDCIPDLAIAVDCNEKLMLGKSYRIFQRAKAIIEIDHHLFRKPFGGFLLIDTEAAAVGEIIYLLLKSLKLRLDNDIAQNILTSLIVETNSFRLASTREATFRICAKLMAIGVDFSRLTEMIYWSSSKQAMLLSGICFSRCRFLKHDRLVWSIVRIRDFRAAGGRDEDVDAVADDMRAIKSVQVSILFREKSPKHLRVSLRSKGQINIGSLAEKYSGGGHFDVAGCVIPNNPGSIKKFLKEAASLI